MDKPSEKYMYPSWVYKAISSVDGCTYALVRIEGKQMTILFTEIPQLVLYRFSVGQ
jgi:hypothetical protein